MTRLEEIGVALLVGGVRAITLKDQRRKLELQRSGSWSDVDRIRGQLLKYIGADLRSRLGGVCPSQVLDTGGRMTCCILDDDGHTSHVSVTGRAWEEVIALKQT